MIEQFTDELGPSVTLDVYSSNEEAIAKLEAAGGTSGYDVLVPTGAYIPQLVAKGLIDPLDKDLLPNLVNVDPLYLDQPWDPGNEYSVPKDWGSTGWVYDNTVITETIETWQDFIDAAASDGVSGQVSVLDVPPDLAGIYFWANGIPWTTEDPADLDAYEAWVLDWIGNVKAFDSFPGINLTSGNYVLSQVFNGDARQGLLSVDDPDKFTWGLGAPASEIWMDNWVIVTGANNPAAAHGWINYMLDPAVSFQDLQFHGYHTGIKGIEAQGADLPFADLVFFTPEQVATLEPGVVNAAQDRLVEIYNAAKAQAGA